MACKPKVQAENWVDYCTDSPGCPGCTVDGNVDWGQQPIVFPNGGIGPGPMERRILTDATSRFRGGDIAAGVELADRLREYQFTDEAIAIYGQTIAAINVTGPQDASLLARVYEGRGRALDQLGLTRAATEAFAQSRQFERIAGLLTTQPAVDTRGLRSFRRPRGSGR